MSHRKLDLALAFLQSQPDAAAAVLEQQTAASAAAFLRQIPHAQAAPVLRRMLPQYIARVLEHLEPTVAGRFLSEMDTHFVVSILRLCTDEARSALLAAMTERAGLACKLLLRFSEEQVGAWMTTAVMTLPDDCTVGEARARLASGDDFIEIERTPVVDREGKLQGVVATAGLLRAAPEAPLVSVMGEASEVIPGRASLAAAADHFAWAHGDSVAVVNRKQRVVGILRHVDLRRGLEAMADTVAVPSAGEPLLGLLELYGSSLMALLGTVFDHGGGRALRPGRSAAQRSGSEGPQGDTL